MSEKEKVISDLDTAIEDVARVRGIIGSLKVGEVFDSVKITPISGLLITACDYLIENLEQLRTSIEMV